MKPYIVSLEATRDAARYSIAGFGFEQLEFQVTGCPPTPQLEIVSPIYKRVLWSLFMDKTFGSIH
jgi:hypothetical protein